MSLKEQMITDKAIFFNTDEFAESIIYNSVTIKAIVTRGEAPRDGNEYSNEGMTDEITLEIAVSDVPNVSGMDNIVVDGKTYTGVKVWKSDGVTQILKASTGERMY